MSPEQIRRMVFLPLWLLVMCCCTGLFTERAACGTRRIVTHADVTVVTDPTTGFRPYPGWGVFPGPDVPVRRVLLHVKFGCPDSLRCADWDYLDHIFIRRRGGAGAPSLDFEIGRMLTPYGGAFGKDWEFGWTADVTDFSGLLRDSVEIEYYHSGYEPNEDRGWRISVEFELFEGPPAAEPLSVTKIYDGSFRYGDSARSIEEDLGPVEFTAGPSTEHLRLVVFQTGHGMDDSGCGEFCSRYRTVSFDGRVVDRRDVWRACGDNPLYPQAGTWIFDRANWCPGYLQQPDAYTFPVEAGTAHTFDIDMEPFVIPNASANEAVRAFVVEYGPVRAGDDAALGEIIVPSLTDVHLRKNPACANALVSVRNMGSRPLTSLEIGYGTDGFARRTMSWKGNLPFNAVTAIELPGPIPQRPGPNRFSVGISRPNGREDAWEGDDTASSSFTGVPRHSSPVVLYLKTNNEPGHSAWALKDAEGRVLYNRARGTMDSAAAATDTFRLGPGCYEFTLSDSAGDGLEFWYNVKGGRGICRLMDGEGRMLKGFESDFGSVVSYRFTVAAEPDGLSPPAREPAIGLFPTRTLGTTTLDYFSNDSADVTVEIVTDQGTVPVERHLYHGLRSGTFTYDLSYRPPQRYYLRVLIDGELKFNKRIRVVENLN